MIPGGGKGKGAEFERKICQLLSLWVSDLKRRDLFWRSSMSGGRATIHSRKNDGVEVSSQSGDITPIHALGIPFCDRYFVELKFRKSLDAERMLFGADPDTEYWFKPCEQAAVYDKQPFVVLKQNHREPVLWTSEKSAQWLSYAYPDLIPRAYFARLGLYIYPFAELLVLPYASLAAQWKPRLKRKNLVV